MCRPGQPTAGDAAAVGEGGRPLVATAHELVWKITESFDPKHSIHFNYEGFEGLCEIAEHRTKVSRWASEIATLLRAERADLFNAIQAAGNSAAAPLPPTVRLTPRERCCGRRRPPRGSASRTSRSRQ
jgi:hypothetical protein